MTNQNGYQGGGAEYGAPQYASQQPSMRPAGSQPPATYPPHVDEPWGKSGAPSAQLQSPPSVSVAASAAAALASLGDDAVYLSRSYKAHGEDVQVVRFRRPTGRDAAQCGYPFRVVQSPGSPDGMEYKVIPEAVSKLIVALSSPPLPRSTVDVLDIRDWNACSGKINSFFLE